ncbi:sacsin N-terminal ATP-binding-like domain-containing protein [Enterocloster bolteae]|uniref:sacsin N-terminal ATP-binding-like domain-containing protein n=1 Tax=Enterocloster bolteae TaxID=208479 RepID=UPI001408750B|nr:ATP-binding protein [Enterocloster bolteae]
MYSDKIQQVRVGALETGVANRIMDLLDKLRLNSDENSAKRWIWELIQNAKDVVNTTGAVNINIHFDADKSIIRFEHDGKLFSTESLIYLIEQVSTKDRDKESKTTGKFGTGFLTTHLLSEVVTVSGILKDNDSSIYRKFNIELDRSGENKEEIIAAIQKSFKALNESRELSTNMVINEKDFNTSFAYQLNETGIKVAKEGLADLYISIPYVFAFVPEINSISVDAYRWYFERGNTHSTRKNNLKVHETKCKENIFNERIVYIAVLEEEAVSVAVEIEKGDRISILENSKALPKLFCEFPLLGTEEFSFPVVVNSKRFNPTEPRDGIFLTDKSSSKIVENKNLINKAYALYVELLEYVSERNYQQIYNMTKICDPAEKSWLSNHWFNENVISKCKESLRYMPMIDTEIGERKALYNKLDEPQIWIIGDRDSNLRRSVWKLENHIMPEMLTRRSEIHYWYHSLGREFHNFNIKKLIKQVEEYETLDKLAEFFILSDITETDWLNELFELIGRHNIGQTYILNESIKIFPNQNGDFCSAETLCKDLNVDENYKDVLTLLGGDCRTKLLHKAVNISEWVVFDDYCSDNIFSEIIGLLEQETDKKDIVYGRLVTLYNDLDENMKKAETLDELMKRYNINNHEMLEEILNNSMNYSPISQDKNNDKTEVTEDLLIQSGIYDEAGLVKAISNNVFGENFIHMSEQDSEKFKYVNEILERSKQNVLNYLRHIPEYNLDNMIELDRTIFLIKKYDTDIFLIIRPSDYKQVILYYDSEMDILDYEKDWELWVEDGKNTPEKITFGKMLKLTGINKIPLRKVR